MIDGLAALLAHGANLPKSHRIADRGALEALLRRHVKAYLQTA